MKSICSLILLACLPLCALGADTYLVWVEESSDGKALADPAPSQAGLMSLLFARGHILFDLGAQKVPLDWEGRDFSAALSAARSIEADFLAAAQVRAQTTPAPQKAPLVTAAARYVLLQAKTGALLAEGRLSLDNREREKELPYGRLLFRLGEAVAEALLASRDKDANKL